MNRSLMERWLSAYPQRDPSGHAEALSGHCDAWALALCRGLNERGIPASLQVVERVRLAEDGHVVDDNPLSHVVVFAWGTTWDASGPDAFERWESAWIQPWVKDHKGRCEDATAEDQFDLVPISEDGLITLRQQRDRRSPDASRSERYATQLADVLARLTPVAAPRRLTA